MDKYKFKKSIPAFFILLLVLIGSIFVDRIPSAKASNTKTITVTFKTAPTPASVNVTKAPLKYNKKFAFSYTFDDGYIEGYNPAFRYMHGGYVDELGQIVGGLYYTNGAGNRIPFKGSFNWFSNSSTSFGDLHINTPSNMTWDNLREVYSLGWEPINHGWTSMPTPSPSDTIIDYPAEHGGPRTIDYNYEVTQNTLRFQEELGATIKHFGLPNGDSNYLPAALANGMKSISTGQPGGSENEGLMNVSSDLNLDQMQYKRKYFADTTTIQNMTDYVDKISNDSTGGTNYWGVATSHRVRTPASSPDNGNLSFDNFKNFMDHVANTYGADGDDSVWMASFPEVYEYLVTKQKTSINTELSGDTLTISLDSSLVDDDLRRYALSLVVDADAEIDSITYDEPEFTHHSENISTGLINLDWGFVSLANDITRAESLVTTAEASKVQLDVDTARTYVNLLENGSEKDALFTRLDSIETNLKSWKVSFGYNTSSAGSWNEYNGSITTSAKLELKDSDNNNSSVAVNIQQNFSSKVLTGGKTADPANSGYFPDSYLAGLIRMYSASTDTTPGIVRLSGLDVNKKYKIVLMGSHNLVDATTDKTKTVYSINNEVKELQTSMNTTNVVTYDNTSPDASGNIDISVAKKFANWGYGVLNALQITEEREYTLTYSAGSHGSITGDVSQTLSSGSNGTEVTAVPDSNYHFVDWSDGSTQNPRTDLNVTANKSVSANFAIDTHTLTYVAGDNGSISGTNPQTINYGADGSAVTAVPVTGYHFVKWSDDSTQNPRTDLNVTANKSVSANFAIDTHTLTYVAGDNGSISGTNPQTINYGADGSAVTAVPVTGYHFVKWSDDSTQNPRTDLNVTANKSVTAIFEVNAIESYTLSYSASAGGSISGEISQTVNEGSNGTEVTAVPDSNYHFVDWSDGSTQNPRTDLNVTANKSVSANFAIDVTDSPQKVTTRIGSSAISRYNNLISFNNKIEADKLISQYPDSFTNKEIPSKNSKFIFTKNLKLKSVNNEVLELQKYLNSKGFIVSSIGPGSKGKETNYFGSLTRKAVINFQIANGLKGDGMVGPATRLKLNSL